MTTATLPTEIETVPARRCDVASSSATNPQHLDVATAATQRHRPRPTRRRPDHAAAEDGGAASVELTLVLPVFLALCWLTLQAGMWWHAQHIAQASAAAGARAAHLLDASDGDGHDAARAVLDRYAGNVLHSPEVDVDRRPDTVRVTVTGTALAVIPGLDVPVTARATYPLPQPGSP